MKPANVGNYVFVTMIALVITRPPTATRIERQGERHGERCDGPGARVCIAIVDRIIRAERFCFYTAVLSARLLELFGNSGKLVLGAVGILYTKMEPISSTMSRIAQLNEQMCKD